jgi:hypothetical protein
MRCSLCNSEIVRGEESWLAVEEVVGKDGETFSWTCHWRCYCGESVGVVEGIRECPKWELDWSCPDCGKRWRLSRPTVVGSELRKVCWACSPEEAPGWTYHWYREADDEGR